MLNLTQHATNAAWARQFLNYLLQKCPENIGNIIQSAFNPAAGHLAWIISERLINMPPQVAGPAWNMLLEEVEWAVQDHEPYQFEWWLITSKIYASIPKDGGKKPRMELFYMHPEDEVISQVSFDCLYQYAAWAFDFEFTNKEDMAVADSKRAFYDSGVQSMRRVFLVPNDKVASMVSAVQQAVAV